MDRVRTPRSAPMVALLSSSKCPSLNLSIRLVLPTEESPTRTILKTRSYSSLAAICLWVGLAHAHASNPGPAGQLNARFIYGPERARLPPAWASATERAGVAGMSNRGWANWQLGPLGQNPV